MRARTSTFWPSRGGEGTQHISLPEHAQRTCAAASFSEKYQCPELGLAKLEISRLEPQAAETALQQHPHLAIEARNGVNVALGAREGTGQFGRSPCAK